MIVTGNVQVSRTHLTLGRDVSLPSILSDKNLQPFQRLAQVIHGEERGSAAASSRPLAIMQLSHAGRQSPNFIGGRLLFAKPSAPSAITMGTGKQGQGIVSAIVQSLLFRKPRAMSLADIDDVVNSFVRGAKLAATAGFDGIQLHAAHGCECLIFSLKFPGLIREVRSHCSVHVTEGKFNRSKLRLTVLLNGQRPIVVSMNIPATLPAVSNSSTE